MNDYMHLIGADEVKSAGSSMCSAANDLRRAADVFDESLHRHQLFLDDWLQRLEGILTNKINKE